MNRRLGTIQRRQLEEKLERLRAVSASEPPKSGWINAIRSALGMSSEQLAARIGVTRQAVLQFESAERKRTASWTSLRKVAEAMDCDVVVAVVPRGSLGQVLMRQGRIQAERQISRISHSMKLDAHVVGPDELARQVEELATQLVADASPTLWAAEPPSGDQIPDDHGRTRRAG